jgi:outer membrane protein OmpA-like peptidoglycan-associated protein
MAVMEKPTHRKELGGRTISFIPQHRHAEDNESHWISLSDMMTGLMMIFLLVSISFMVNANAQRRYVTDIVTTYHDVKLALYDDLFKEFNQDLKTWGGELEPKTLTIRFNDPEVLFETGKSTLKPNFKSILGNFVPRYVRIMTQDKYTKNVQEVRIEGHTSSEWNGNMTGDAAYLHNMDLSQQRTRSVLAYILGLNTVKVHDQWLKEHVTANGLSSSKLIKQGGVENKDASRRVEFRVVTNTESLVDELCSKVGI